MARDPKNHPSSSDATGKGDDELQREQEALERRPDGLIGDTGENRNLTGSSTWETIPEQEAGERRRTTNDKGTDPSSGSSSKR